jgi:hypothetical protein
MISRDPDLVTASARGWKDTGGGFPWSFQPMFDIVLSVPWMSKPLLRFLPGLAKYC